MRDYTVKNANLVLASETLICHQVNCQGKMGSGVALAIKKRFPKVYEEYYNFVQDHKLGNISEELLGKVQYVPIEEKNKPTQYVVNMFAQDKYGSFGVYTSVDAFKKCLEDINRVSVGCSVAFPWKIGCVRGGGDWDTILNLILTTLKDVDSITFYRLDLG